MPILTFYYALYKTFMLVILRFAINSMAGQVRLIRSRMMTYDILIFLHSNSKVFGQSVLGSYSYLDFLRVFNRCFIRCKIVLHCLPKPVSSSIVLFLGSS